MASKGAIKGSDSLKSLGRPLETRFGHRNYFRRKRLAQMQTTRIASLQHE